MGLTVSTGEKLTQEELRLVQGSWKVIMENPEENGIVIFKTFLEKHKYHSQFEKFNGIPLDELPETQQFRNHSLAIIRAINHITENVNDEEKLRSLLYALGKQHKGRKVTEQQFQELKTVILDILKAAFNLPGDTLKAWEKTFDLAFPHVFQGLEDGK